MQKILTLLNPELAHNLTVNILSKTGASPLNLFYRQSVKYSPVDFKLVTACSILENC